MDPASGAGGAFAVMCALWRREQSGQGEQVEFPQSENMLQHIGEYLIDATRTGRRHTPSGNRSIYAAPQGCYPCVGDDEWVVISVPDDESWSALIEAMGSPSWAHDTRFSTTDGRHHHHDELDAHMETWTRTQSSGDVHAKCQARGVPAGPVLRESQLRADPQMEARDWFRDQGSIDLGRHQFPGQQWRWTGPELRWGPINRLGDSNQYVYREILGYDDRRWQALVDGGHIAEVYYGSDGEAL
jgi:crotonobetainyl-CoA:carnitine CoA-transferase CaiB-like acyl-CoA transferase